MNRTMLLVGACPFALALVTGCHHVPATTPVAYEAPAPQAVPAPPPAQPTASAVNVSQDILTACGIKDSSTGDAPRFAFDSSTLSRDDQRLLGEVEHCLTVGPLADRSLKLVGRADPRGTEEYNMHLGDERATSVRVYLERHGLPSAKVSTTSRGALDASGTDENGWMKDRRVDVDLAI